MAMVPGESEVMPRSSGRKYRNVCFTLNNPQELIQFNERMQYLIYQDEIAESGTPHFQGYVEFKTAIALNPVKEMLGGPTVHIEPRRGTQAQAIAYCKKADTRKPDTEPLEFGEPNKQGKRQDLEDFKDAITAGKRKRDLLDDHLQIFAKYPRLYAELQLDNRPKRGEGEENQLKVTLLIGETGLGKTRYVYERYVDDPEFYIAPLNSDKQWWTGYDGHKTVLMDDFCGKRSHLPLGYLLRLLDRYPVEVETKGGQTFWMPNHIYITVVNRLFKALY